MKLEGKVTKVSISNSKGASVKAIDDNTFIETIQMIISSAMKQNGIVNRATPDFDIELVYDDHTSRNLYLWVGEKGETSTFMKADDTHTIFTVSGELTDQLIEFLK